MSFMSAPNPEVTHGRLGLLVREQREKLGLSMGEVADRARVSRSTIHRLEHSSPIKPTPSKLARILAVVGLEPEAVRLALPDDDEYRGDVLHWLERTASDVALSELVEQQRRPVEPDLVALHPDGTVARIQADDRLDEISHALKGAGWLVTRPA